MNVGAAVAAAHAGEGGDGVSVAVTVTERDSRRRFTVSTVLYIRLYSLCGGNLS